MNDHELRKHSLTLGIRSMWRNWTYPLAAIMVAILLTTVIPKTAMPLLLLAEVAILIAAIRNNRSVETPYCYKIPYVVAIILFWSAVAFLIISFMKHQANAVEFNGQPYNASMPHFIILIVAPLGTIISFRFIMLKNSAFCNDCEARLGNAVERGFLAKMFKQESAYQLKCMMWMWLGLSIAEWTFYLLFHKTSNISTADRFFFIWLPSSVFVLSFIYMGIRYYGIWNYYTEQNPGGQLLNQGYSRIRFLVICNDKMWLYIPEPNPDIITPESFFIDTPVKTSVPFKKNVTLIDGIEYFSRISHIAGASLKSLYVSSDARELSNIFHFAAFIEDFKQTETSELKGVWMTLAEIQELHSMGMLSPMIEAEIDRIYRTVMAWKTYDRDGNRLYTIKHYRPTFRLSDMKKWDVDYNDPRWLFIEMNNEDRPFFKLRRMWRKFITGIGS